ncbi:DUF6344 domain-containing protein [Streptomyces sp. NPDC058683]|uniref:DUF6344 domain-containing protein n=1 Tax=Streptomyces sp. NPDC058683 TaxID=3346597 RepID=UPI0036558A6D
MARNAKVMKLWTAFVTAFLALCTALGLVSAATATAVPQTETPRNSNPGDDHSPAGRVMIPAQTHWLWSQARSLPPTMKQRIRAEAHGKTPGCRQRPLDTTESEENPAEPPAAPLDC